MNTEIDGKDTNKFLAQNMLTEEIFNSDISNSLDEQDEVDISILNSRDDKTFQQCSSVGNIYSNEELNENLQTLKG